MGIELVKMTQSLLFLPSLGLIFRVLKKFIFIIFTTILIDFMEEWSFRGPYIGSTSPILGFKGF